MRATVRAGLWRGIGAQLDHARDVRLVVGRPDRPDHDLVGRPGSIPVRTSSSRMTWDPGDRILRSEAPPAYPGGTRPAAITTSGPSSCLTWIVGGVGFGVSKGTGRQGGVGLATGSCGLATQGLGFRQG